MFGNTFNPSGDGNSQMLLGNLRNSQVPAASIQYAVIGTLNAFEVISWNMEITKRCNISNLRISLTSIAQPLSGSIVFTLLKNNLPTPLSVTFPPGALGIVLSDTINIVSFMPGDVVVLRAQNNAAGLSGSFSRHSTLATFF